MQRNEKGGNHRERGNRKKGNGHEAEPFDLRRRMCANFDLLFHGWMSAFLPAIRNLSALVGQPSCRKTNEVGGEQGKVFLQAHRWARAHLDVLNFKNLFAFLVGRFDGLAGVVLMKPTR